MDVANVLFQERYSTRQEGPKILHIPAQKRLVKRRCRLSSIAVKCACGAVRRRTILRTRLLRHLQVIGIF